MTIGVHPNREKVPFASFVKNFGGTSEYEDELEIDQSSNFEGIYTNDFSEEEVGLYALEIIPKVRVLSDQKVRGDDN
jgi:hypothetical protein